jgi:polyhydroxyalkanoate synthesis repressor PhaR
VQFGEKAVTETTRRPAAGTLAHPAQPAESGRESSNPPPMSQPAAERTIKKYSNRRLYDTTVSRYITLEDVRRLVKEEVLFRVVDARTGEDLTRNILLQLILEQEEKGQAIFSTDLLQLFVRTYGDAMQGFMAVYIRESLAVFLKQQQIIEEQLANLIKTAPVTVFAELARQNLRLLQSMQEGFVNARGREDPKADAGGEEKDMK